VRPQLLDELVGHNDAKMKARIAIQAALNRDEPLPHCLLTSGVGGVGKTSFAGVLANELYAPFAATSGTCLSTPTDLRNALIRLKPRTVLLCDEAHLLGRSAGEELLIVLEEGVLNVNSNGTPIRLPLPPFTFIAATTKPESLSAPLSQRFGLRFHLLPLAATEIEQVVRRAFEHWRMEVASEVVTGIAQRARGVPRISLRLSERVRDAVQASCAATATHQHLDLAMRVEGIDEVGLTNEERMLLRCLADAEPRPVSARSLALALGCGVETITDVLEPTLVRFGLMTIGTGGRRLTAKGSEHLAGYAPNELDGAGA
jgi:Holliday junction DNA helicase RuvB